MRTPLNHNGMTLLELMMAIGFSVVLLAGVIAFYNASSQSYNAGLSGDNLQTAANTILTKIIEGENESGVTYRLATSVSYMIPNGVGSALYSCGGAPQSTSCNASNTASELYFCQDSPCIGPTDPTARWYYLDSSGTNVYYHHPTSAGTVEEKIYTAPKGSALNLRFSPAGVPFAALNVVEIDVDLTTNIAPQTTNNRLATSGDASTFVLLRSHP